MKSRASGNDGAVPRNASRTPARASARPGDVPAATRPTTPGWRDPRLWIGVVLVTGSVVAGARILSGADARAKIDAGASLVQLYTGFIYKGPALVGEARRALR